MMNRMARQAAPSAEFLKYQAVQSEPIAQEKWWDFQAANESLGELTAILPTMLEFWAKGSQMFPRKMSGYQAIQTLNAALAAAAPYIEAPFGDYTPATGKKKRKPWHVAAIAIYPEVGRILVAAGHKLPKTISHTTIWATVTFQALQRLELPDARMMELKAVATYLDRWAKNGGMTAKHVAALCYLDAKQG